MSDVNDNSPVFTNDVYEFSLSENISVGTPVFNLIATDADFGFNGLVNYTIVYEESTSRGMVFESKFSNIGSLNVYYQTVNDSIFFCFQTSHLL